MKRAICTVTSFSHLSQSLAMAESALNCFVSIAVHIFVTDKPRNEKNLQSPLKNVFLHFPGERLLAGKTEPYLKKYSAQPDFMRWSLKPVLMRFLLADLGYTSVFFADNDLYFFEKADVLFTELEQNRFLLCPHWRIKDPHISKAWFDVNFTDGLYNGGFVGATSDGLEILDWWAMACLYACEINFAKGRRGAQKYLDLVPADFDGVGTIRHRGCNVAYWNQHENQRSWKDGKVWINDTWPVIFVHFTAKLEKEISSGTDGQLRTYLDTYKQVVDKHKQLFH